MYRPLGILFSVTGAILAGTIFKQVWKLISGEEEAPKARESEYGWREVLIAAAAQGAVFGLVKAAVDRGGLEAFRKLTGIWAAD
jgi:hypothetical protein